MKSIAVGYWQALTDHWYLNYGYVVVLKHILYKYVNEIKVFIPLTV